MLAISIGTNIGNKNRNIEKALELIRIKIGSIISVSSIYETEPWGFKSEHWFYNAVCLAETEFSPQDVMKQLLSMEQSMGRIRNLSKEYKNRIIDLDILFFDDEIINLDTLKIPHPHLHERLFVLKPLNEVCPEWNHPVFKKTVKQLLSECEDKQDVRKMS
jgi:2-amino-4-hydroxy-6-hydroxymethyldihydropteridine diphosphokinase